MDQAIIDSLFDGPKSFYINTPILDIEYQYGRVLLFWGLDYLRAQFEIDLLAISGCLDSGLL